MTVTEPELGGTRSKDAGWGHLRLFVEAIVFTIVVPGAVSYWIPKDLLGIWGAVLPQPWTIWQILGLVPLTVGTGVYLRCAWEFAARGRGIPFPVDHPKRLVVTGLYRYVRNPMYLGVLLFMLGESLFFTSARFFAYTIAWLTFIHLNILIYEEPNLRHKFGDSYAQYTSSVRRWVPGRPYRQDA